MLWDKTVLHNIRRKAKHVMLDHLPLDLFTRTSHSSGGIQTDMPDTQCSSFMDLAYK